MNQYAFPPLITSIAILLYGFYVFSRNFRSSIYFSFFLITTALSLWLFSFSMLFVSTGSHAAFIWAKIGYIGIVYIPVAVYQFTVFFLNLKNQKKILIINYVLYAVFVLLMNSAVSIKGMKHYFFGYYPKAGSLQILFVIFFFVLFYAAIQNLRVERKKAEPGSTLQMRMKYMMWGVITASLAAVDFLPAYGIEIYPFGFLFTIVFMLVSSYSFVKYRIIDIETLITRALGFMIFSAIVLVSYVIVFSFAGSFMQERTDAFKATTSGLVLVAVIAIFAIFRNKIWDFVNRLFYKEKYKYRKSFNKFLRKMNDIKNLDDILLFMTGTVVETIKTENFSIMLLDPDGVEYRIKSHLGIKNPDTSIAKNDPFLLWLFSQRRVVEKDLIEIDPMYSKMKDIGLGRFNDLESEICIPLVVFNQIIGLFNIGKKKSGEAYNQDDIDWLENISRYSAITINNALTGNILEKRTQQLLVMCKVTQDVGASLELSSVLNAYVRNIKSIVNADIVSVLLFDDKSSELVIKASIGLAENNILGTHLRRGEKISGWVLNNAQPLLIYDLNSDPLFSKRQSEKYYSNSLMSIPLVLRGKVIGVVNVCNSKESKIFTIHDLDMLMGITGEVTTIIENARFYTSLKESYLRTIQSLAEALNAKDDYTSGHAVRVCEYVNKITKYLNLSQPECENIATAAMLHDIGKIGIKEAVLQKEEGLTIKEYEEIKKHPEMSEKIVRPIGLSEEILSIIKHHHEWYNGEGYPEGISQAEIPLGARILSVADAYDAMTTNRPYRKAFSKEKAISELVKGKNTQFDPAIVEAFMGCIEK